MATLNKAKTPGQKIKIGTKVLCGVDAVDTTPIASRVAAFQLVHQQYMAVDQGVQSSTRACHDKRGVVAAAYDDMHITIEALAIALPNDGFARRQPFQSFGVPSPSALKGMAVAEGAEMVIVLEKAVLRHPGVSAKSSHAAKAAGNAARKLLEALKMLTVREKSRGDAIAKRDAFTPAWDKAFQSLKMSARLAEAEGHAGLFDALFERPASPRKKASSKRKVPPKPDVAPLSVPG